MLDKAVAAVKADQAVAVAMFIKGEGGFLDRELAMPAMRPLLPSPRPNSAHQETSQTCLMSDVVGFMRKIV
jgi:hypothetical protein